MSRRAGRPALLESDGGARSCFTIAVSQRAPIQSAPSQPLSSPHQSPPAHQPHAQAKIRLLNLRLRLESCIWALIPMMNLGVTRFRTRDTKRVAPVNTAKIR